MSRPHVFLPRVLALMTEGQIHGYGIAKRLGVERTRVARALGTARRLQFVRDVGPGCQTAGPPRKYIEITDEGRAYLEKR